MGRTIKYKYRIEAKCVDKNFGFSHCVWRKEYGRVNLENLIKYRNGFNQSLKPGGANVHLGINMAIGDCWIVENTSNGKVICEVKQPIFEVL